MATNYSVVTLPPALLGLAATVYALVSNDDATGGVPATSTVVALYQNYGSAKFSADARNAL